MKITPELVESFKEILNNPSKYNFDYMPFKDCFVDSDIITPKHILAEQYMNYLNNSAVNKFIVYLLMDAEFGFCHGKADSGESGYKLKISPVILAKIIKHVMTAPVF